MVFEHANTWTGVEKMLLEYKDGHERVEGVARASFWAN